MTRDAAVKRYAGNPILTRDDVPYPVEAVHNAGVVKTRDGQYVMVFRVRRRNGRSILGVAESEDGFAFRVRPEPLLVPAESGAFAEYEEYGVEDPRICMIEDAYWITYSAHSRYGCRVALAWSKDLREVERVSLITDSDTRHAVLFPEKFDGRYARLYRPHTQTIPWSIWIAYSLDLIHWGDARVVHVPEPYHWDELKVAPGATPFRTDEGWLHIHHGVLESSSGLVYRLGAALHRLDDPSEVLGVADDWILQPEDPWERTGSASNVVFSCGAVPEEDGTVKVYWGAADTVLCAGTAVVEELVALCKEHGRSPLYSAALRWRPNQRSRAARRHRTRRSI